MAPKRAQDAESSNTPEANTMKRPKASRACATCRKTKSRCELLGVAPGVNGRLQCHRCKVLDIECSFHNSDIIIVARHNEASTSGHGGPNTPGQQQSTRSSPSTEQFGVQKDFTSNNEVELPDEGADVLDAETYVLGPWRVLGIADDAYWTRQPILAIRGILPPLPAHEPNGSINYVDDSLPSVLSHGRIRYLIDIFETRYRPWMSLPPANVSDTALDLVRCTVAARHLDSKTRSDVAPRLQALVESTLLQPGYPHTKTVEFIEALLILALWTPVCGHGYAIERDSRLLASSAMQIAISLGLDQYDNIQVLQQSKADTDGPDPEVVRKTRLWCAASNIEHMLLVGAGRDPQSRRTPEERRADFTASYLTLDPRDIRLGISRRLFDLTDVGSSVCWGPSRAEQEYASKEINDLIASFNWLHRLITPLPLVFQLDAFYFSMLEVSYHVYKMKTLYRNLYGLKSVFDRPYKEWLRLELNGLPIAAVWGREMVALSEAAIVSLLSHIDTASLSTAPDPYFLLITYAGLSLLSTKIAVYHIGFPSLVGHGDALLDMAMERLQQAALSSDHMPARCATALREAVATWDRKREEGLAAKQSVNGVSQDKPMEVPAFEQGAQAPGQGTSSEPYPAIDPLVSMFDPFFGVPMVDEVDHSLFDHQFWNFFVNNRTDPPTQP
ncbi:Protease transcriptional activator prtT [Pleurotus pulmonarius]